MANGSLPLLLKLHGKTKCITEESDQFIPFEMDGLIFICHFKLLRLGVPIGYSSPNTMKNISAAIKCGQVGDAALLSPTIMCTIPLVLGKIYKTISEGANKKGYVFKKVLDFCYNYKLWWNI